MGRNGAVAGSGPHNSELPEDRILLNNSVINVRACLGAHWSFFILILGTDLKSWRMSSFFLIPYICYKKYINGRHNIMLLMEYLLRLCSLDIPTKRCRSLIYPAQRYCGWSRKLKAYDPVNSRTHIGWSSWYHI